MYGLKSDIFEFSTPILLSRRGHFMHATPFSAKYVGCWFTSENN